VVVPDALLGLRFNEEEESYFMLEIDRGEMPIDRYKNLHRSSAVRVNTREPWFLSPEILREMAERGDCTEALDGPVQPARFLRTRAVERIEIPLFSTENRIYPGSQQAGARVLLEDFGIADVSA